jgi:catechol 2,3-dioxygenase-like lactoylglutathione lyase family enzyme
MIKGIDHIGIAVKSIDEAKKFWVDTLGLKHLRTDNVPGKKCASLSWRRAKPPSNCWSQPRRTAPCRSS